MRAEAGQVLLREDTHLLGEGLLELARGDMRGSTKSSITGWGAVGWPRSHETKGVEEIRYSCLLL